MTLLFDRVRVRMVLLRALVASIFTLFGTTHGVAQSPEYIIGVHDVLAVTVWNQPDLSGKFTVEADGAFVFPLIGRVNAGGLALRAVEAAVSVRLADGFLANPQVGITIDNYRSQRVFIVGEVRQPGAYPVTGTMTLIEALAHSGSTTANAAEEVVILRSTDEVTDRSLLPENGAGRVEKVDLTELENGRFDRNLLVRGGDTVFVPRAQTAFVYGQVKAPGAFVVGKSTTVMQLIALAGGVSERGSAGHVKMIRAGAKTETKAKLTDPVRAGDTIIVPERFF